MSSSDVKYRTARNTIQQRPICQELSMGDIIEHFYDIQSECMDVRWMDEADEDLLDILGDDVAYEFHGPLQRI